MRQQHVAEREVVVRQRRDRRPDGILVQAVREGVGAGDLGGQDLFEPADAEPGGWEDGGAVLAVQEEREPEG